MFPCATISLYFIPSPPSPIHTVTHAIITTLLTVTCAQAQALPIMLLIPWALSIHGRQ